MLAALVLRIACASVANMMTPRLLAAHRPLR
jgi:hypothetical protein